MYLGHIVREAKVSANPRGRSVTEAALRIVCGRIRSITRSTGRTAGGVAYA